MSQLTGKRLYSAKDKLADTIEAEAKAKAEKKVESKSKAKKTK